jgi:hypothetical protein
MTNSLQLEACLTPDVFPKCRHPRTPENSKLRGKSFVCRTCVQEGGRRWAAALRRRRGIPTKDTSFFSSDTKIGRVRASTFDFYNKHKEAGLLPTNGRFLFYELVAAEVITKSDNKTVVIALTDLREEGYIPWEDITDETREVIENYHLPTLQESVESQISYAKISLWYPEPPPLVICESRSIRSAIDDLCDEFQVPLASTNGQCAGFLRTKVKDTITPGQVVLYLGDKDFSGGKIEENSLRVLEEVTGEPLQWERVAVTDEQVEKFELIRIMKEDGRTGEEHEAVECEALGQERIMTLLRNRLEELMPESRRNKVQGREESERKRLLKLLAGMKGNR